MANHDSRKSMRSESPRVQFSGEPNHEFVMNERRGDLLAQYHHTISEQLNARLSESPKFFGLLIIVGTGYAYAISDDRLAKVVVPGTLLSLATILWAAWYLAALGYAFRFLQNIQQCIEHALGWNKFAPASTGRPPHSLINPLQWFWLLPGIYHAHAAGLILFFVVVCGTSCRIFWRWWSATIAAINLYYREKFKATRREPSTHLPENTTRAACCTE